MATTSPAARNARQSHLLAQNAGENSDTAQPLRQFSVAQSFKLVSRNNLMLTLSALVYSYLVGAIL